MKVIVHPFNSNEKGMVLVSATIFIVAIMIYSLLFIQMIQTEVKKEQVTEKFNNALYCAEGGLARAKWLLQHDFQWTDTSLSNDPHTVDIKGTITANQSSYKIYLFSLPSQGEPPPIPPGTTLWRYQLPPGPYGSYPYDIQYLDNGNLLITEMHAQQRVFELKPDFKNGGGEVIWTYDNSEKMTSADRMANGHTLVAEPHSYNGWAYEIDSGGNKIWEWKYENYGDTNSWMQDIDELSDGNILITMRYANSPNKVVVVKYPEGNILWHYDANSPTDADRLPNGNILITEKNVSGTTSGRIIEVDYTTKQIVWQTNIFLNNPYDAERLPDGNTVICESGGYDFWDRDNNGRISVVDTTGKEVLGSPLVTGLAAPHAIAIVPLDNGGYDILIANTNSSSSVGNEIMLIKGWGQMASNRIAIVSVGDYLGYASTVIINADLGTSTGTLSNITWKEKKGVPTEYR